MTLATHFANILVHDAIAMTKEDLQSPFPDDETDYFEILHSAVWPHVDFKTPSSSGDAGWRVEFRPMEIQLSDFDNAAFAIFMVLIRQAIAHYDLNFYVAIDKIADNMQRAHGRYAAVDQTFWFRKRCFPSQAHGKEADDKDLPELPDPPEDKLMTIDEIINGNSLNGFYGLLPIIEDYMADVGIDPETKTKLTEYLAVIRDRANGKQWTPAEWMRRFIDQHPEYGHDSVVSERVSYDLLRVIRDIGEGRLDSREVFRRPEWKGH